MILFFTASRDVVICSSRGSATHVSVCLSFIKALLKNRLKGQKWNRKYQETFEANMTNFDWNMKQIWLRQMWVHN